MPPMVKVAQSTGFIGNHATVAYTCSHAIALGNIYTIKAQLFWMGGVSIISGTLSSVSGTISDLKIIVLIIIFPLFL